jgi:hypothetical protein
MNQRPGSVTAIAIWLMLVGLLYALGSLLLFLGQSFIDSEVGRQVLIEDPAWQAMPPEVIALIGPIVLGLAIIMLISAVVCIVTSIGLF